MAYQVCSKVDEKHRDECYANFGVDRAKTERYLDCVKKMEQAYNKPYLLDNLIAGLKTAVDMAFMFCAYVYTFFKMLFYMAIR